MKIRIMSDLHLDVNRNYPLQLPQKDRGIFTILAGDVAGETDWGVQWIKENCPYGVCVAGNHLVYNNYGLTVQALKKSLKEDFPESCTMRFLENDYVQIGDIIIVGATLYTNFKLDGMNQTVGMKIAKRYMNDFRWGMYETDDGMVEDLKPEHYLKIFEESLAYIGKICEDNPDKKIIVVTHHAPSNQSISKRYFGDDSNCCYASNLDKFIKDHSNIKAFIHGHVHNHFDYMIGNCRVLCNPRGYVRYMEDTNWNPCFYLDTDDWTTSFDDSWFSREMSDDEKNRREELSKAYETLFQMM